MDINEQVGQRILEARTKLDLTQEELGNRINRSKSSIASYESGSRGIKLSELPALAEALGVSVTYFFEDKEEKSHLINRYTNHPHNQLISDFIAYLAVLDEPNQTGKSFKVIVEMKKPLSNRQRTDDQIAQEIAYKIMLERSNPGNE